MPAPSGSRRWKRPRRRPARAYAAAAAKLSAARKKAAEKLDKAVNGELKPLKLERAKFSTQIESDAAAAGPNGIDRVEFWVQTNPGTRPGPLMKVASGGELARFLLALKVVLADRGSAPTLVFDEIDTGVGGAVADAIGVRLARLGDRVQVVTVTHAPQVAARAERHYLITKDALEKGKRVATRVTELAAAAPPRGDRAHAGRRRDHRGGARRRREADPRGGGKHDMARLRSISPSSAGTPTTRCSTRSAPTCAKAGHHIVRYAHREAFTATPDPLAGIDILLCVAVFPLTRAMLAAAPRLRAIVSAVTGVEGVDIAGRDRARRWSSPTRRPRRTSSAWPRRRCC